MLTYKNSLILLHFSQKWMNIYENNLKTNTLEQIDYIRFENYLTVMNNRAYE